MTDDLLNLSLIAPDGDISIPYSDLSLLAEARQLISKQLADALPKLQMTFSNQDWLELDKLVFSLYGAVLYCGLPRLKKSLTEAMQLLQNGKPLSAALFRRLEADAKLTVDALEKLIRISTHGA